MESCKEGREERKRKGVEEGTNKTNAEKEMKGFYLDSIFLKLPKQTEITELQHNKGKVKKESEMMSAWIRFNR